MPEKKFQYTDPHFLNKLAVSINRENCEFGAGLHPEVPEFIEAVLSPNRELPYDFRSVQVVALCETHNIMPFQSLAFRRDLCPMIEYHGPNVNHTDISPRIRSSCEHPAYFAMNRKWFSITFDSLVGEERVGKAQAAISEFAKNGYLITRVEAKLNPYTRRGDHCAYREAEAHLWASDGEIIMRGDFPDDFDIQDLIPKELPAVGIPPVGIEGLLKS